MEVEVLEGAGFQFELRSPPDLTLEVAGVRVSVVQVRPEREEQHPSPRKQTLRQHNNQITTEQHFSSFIIRCNGGYVISVMETLHCGYYLLSSTE